MVEFLELFDNVSGHVGEGGKRDDSVVAVQGARLSHRYLSGDLEVIFVSEFGDHAKYGFAIGVNQLGESGFAFNETIPPMASNDSGARFDSQKSLVFPGIVEVVQLPEEGVPSVVRLDRFDYLALRIGEPLYEVSPLVFSRQKLGLGLGDGKICLVPIRHVVAVGKGRREYIERAADRVDVGPEFDRKLKGYGRFLECYEKVVSGVRIKIFDAQINIDVEPSLHPLLEGWQVGYGPINRRIGVCNVGAHEKPQYELNQTKKRGLDLSAP